MAQVDSRIAMGVQPLDVGASIGRGYQLRDLAAQADARKLDTQLKQQAVQKQKTLGDLYRGALGPDGKIDRTKVTQGVVEAGFGADLPDMHKQWSDADKAEADYFSKNSETIVKQLDYTSKTIGALLQNPNTTAQDVARAVSGLTQFGLLKPEQGAEIVRSIPGDPQQLQQYLRAKLMESQQAKDMLSAALPNLQAINLGGHTQLVDTNPLTNPQAVGQRLDRSATIGEQESARHNRASEGLTARGQNMVDARTREANATALSKPFEVTGPDGKPMLVQQDKAGNIRPVTGYLPKTGADKALTEGQSKAVLFGSRMEAANRIFDDLAKQGVTTSIPGSRSGLGVGSIINATSSAAHQQLDQAKRDFINATLRRESGAAIGQSEFDNAEKQYFPQIGDSPAVIAQKARNRSIAVRGMQAEIPAAHRHLVGEVIDGVPSNGGKASESSPKTPNVVNFSDLK